MGTLFPQDLNIKERLLYDPFSLFFLFFGFSWLFYVIFTFILFFKKKNSYYIISRSTYLIFFSAIGQCLMMLLYSMKMVIGPENFPNLLDVLILWFTMPLHFLPYPLRCIRYILLYHLAREEGRSLNNRYHHSNKELQNECGFLNKIVKFFKKHPYLKTDGFFCCILWVLLLFCVILGLLRIIDPKYNNLPGNYGSGTTRFYYTSALLMFFIVFLFLSLGVFFVMRLKNEFMITCEFISIDIIWSVSILPYSFLGMVDASRYQIPITIIGIIECVASFVVSFGVPIQLAYIKRNTAPDDTEKNMFKNLENVLNDEKASALVYNFTVSRMCNEAFLFVKYVHNYKKLSDHDELNRMYHLIVDKFIANNAPHRINIGYQIKKEFMNHQKENGITNDSFTKIYNEVKKTIMTDIMPTFINSKIAKEYQDELLTQSQYNNSV